MARSRRIVGGLLLAALAVSAAVGLWGWLQIVREEVAFRNGGVALAGTFYRPRGSAPVPAVVLIHGSGRTTRDDVRWYARRFAAHGIAALAYDKRGTGASSGDSTAWRRFNFADLAGDAAAGVAYLRTRPDIDGDRVGVFAASQGGWVAPLVAAQDGRIAWMVIMSGSVSTVGEDRLFERAARLRQEGFTEQEVADARAMQVVDQAVTRDGSRWDEFTTLWQTHQDTRWFRRVYLDEAPTPPDGPYRQWYRTVLDVDPVPTLEHLSVPTLWLFGDPAIDRLGPVTRSVEQLERLAREGKPYRVQVYPGADHNLRPASWEEDVWQWLAGILPP